MARVCILTSAHPAFDIRIFHKQARSLADSGYDVTLITQAGRSQLTARVRLLALPEPTNRLQRMWGTWRMLRAALQQRADVYHFHDPELIPAGILLKVLTGQPVIYDVHEDYPKFIAIKHWLPKPLRKVTAAAFDILEQISSRFFDVIVAATDDIARNFRRDRVVVIKNYPILTEVPLSGSIPVSARRRVELIHIGTLSTVTGIPQTVEALAYIDSAFDVHLTLAGRFAGDGCQEQITASDQAWRVDYVGWLDQAELLQYVIQSDIGLACLLPIPQFVTSEPNKLFEYMRCGLPIVASDFPLWREIIEGARCGVVVNPQDPQAIGQAISDLLSDPERMRTMGENGRRAVRDTYNWDSQKTRLLETYSTIVDQ